MKSALAGQQPLRKILLNADWVYLVHSFADRTRDPTIIIAKPKQLAENRHSAPLLPRQDTTLNVDPEMYQTWLQGDDEHS